MGTGPRHAIYFAPDEGTPLWAFGNAWLGRDAATGEALTRPPADGFDTARLDAITGTAANYGFHATLKPPFAPAEGFGEADVIAAARSFASGRRRFVVPPLVLAPLGGFIALQLSAPCAEMNALANACVEAFETLRAPPSDAELAKRRSGGLTRRQEDLLVRWGYPYVFDEWQFHMTLSCRLDDDERDRLLAGLAPAVVPLTNVPLPVESICVFSQPDRGAPFRLAARCPFAGC